MKILYFGGQKSGKSRLSEGKAISLSKNAKPYYVATYDKSFDDKEMNNRVSKHQKERIDKFETIEESFDLTKVIKKEETYLVECLSMWILNNINKSEEELLTQLEVLKNSKADIVFVLNDVNSGVIPLGNESRKFVDLTGIIGQKVASFCDEVYEVKLGLPQRLK